MNRQKAQQFEQFHVNYDWIISDNNWKSKNILEVFINVYYAC